MEEAKALKPMLNLLDPPRHDQLRALVSRAFTFRRVQEMEPKILTTLSRTSNALCSMSRTGHNHEGLHLQKMSHGM